MKAILLAGGQGTRLRPLTLGTPKPVVPIFDRPFLHYQIDRLLQVPEVDEVILSLNYQPDRIEQVLGRTTESGLPLRYVVEPTPLGTGGAIKFAAHGVTDTVVVFNGDVLTEIDLADVVARHRARRARATIVLTPVDNPSAYGLVETDDEGNVQRFREKPGPDEITSNHINAGIYVLEPDTFDRIPAGQPWSIERAYFPSLVDRGETFLGYVYRGYWIDIGTPEKYVQVHNDIMDGRFEAGPFRGAGPTGALISPTAVVDPLARVEGPCFIGERVRVGPDAYIGPHAVLGAGAEIGAGARLSEAVLWPECLVGDEAEVRTAILGRGCRVGANASVAGAVLGDGSILAPYSRI